MPAKLNQSKYTADLEDKDEGHDGVPSWISTFGLDQFRTTMQRQGKPLEGVPHSS